MFEEKRWVRIPDALFFQEGPGVRNSQYTTEGVKLLNVANLVDGKIDLSTSDRYISNIEAYGKYKHFLCDAGDLIVASSGIKVDYIDKKMGFVSDNMLPLCMNTSTIRFKVLDNSFLNIRYFMYFLKSANFKKQLTKLITGSAQLNYGPSHLEKMSFPICSKLSQNRIVLKLDLVQQIIEKLNNQLLKYDELIKARFVEMFGDPCKNDLEWKIAKLGNLTCKIGSGATPKGGKESYIGQGITFVRSMNVHDAHFVYKDLAHLNEEQANQLKNVEVKENDVFLNITGASVARACVVPSNILPARVNQHVCIIRCLPEFIDSIFLNYLFINNSYKNALIEIGESNGATRQAITKKQLEELEIIVPPLTLQNRFTDFVKQVDKSKFIQMNSTI